jgi:hypothetical protein
VLGAFLVLTVILWVRSHFARDLLMVSDGYDWTLQAGTSPGALHLSVAEPAIPSRNWAWYTNQDPPDDRPVLLSTQGPGEWYRLGIASTAGSGRLSSGRAYEYSATTIPFWGLASALAALPLLTLIVTACREHKSRRRLARGRCPDCGRSLSGSAYHCPVCGHRVPPTFLSASPRRLGR